MLDWLQDICYSFNTFKFKPPENGFLREVSWWRTSVLQITWWGLRSCEYIKVPFFLFIFIFIHLNKSAFVSLSFCPSVGCSDFVHLLVVSCFPLVSLPAHLSLVSLVSSALFSVFHLQLVPSLVQFVTLSLRWFTRVCWEAPVDFPSTWRWGELFL